MNGSVFAPSGKSFALAYADDSTDTSTVEGGATAILVTNTDAANVVVFNVGFTDGDTDAVVPISGGAQGKGTVIGPRSTVLLSIPQCAYTSTMYVSVAGVSGTGNVYVSTGSLQQ